MAAIVLFTQTGPRHEVNAVLVAGCTDLVVDLVRSGSAVVYACPDGTDDDDFTDPAFTSGVGVASWSHGDLGGYTGLFLIPGGAIPINGCEGGFDITAMEGTVLFAVPTTNDYCAEYPTLPGAYGPFTVEWSQ